MSAREESEKSLEFREKKSEMKYFYFSPFARMTTICLYERVIFLRSNGGALLQSATVVCCRNNNCFIAEKIGLTPYFPPFFLISVSLSHHSVWHSCTKRNRSNKISFSQIKKINNFFFFAKVFEQLTFCRS